jgi:hypothetical protein
MWNLEIEQSKNLQGPRQGKFAQLPDFPITQSRFRLVPAGRTSLRASLSRSEEIVP